MLAWKYAELLSHTPTIPPSREDETLWETVAQHILVTGIYSRDYLKRHPDFLVPGPGLI